MNLINATPHDIHLYVGETLVHTFPPSGLMPRLETSEIKVSEIVVDGHTIDVVEKEFKEGKESLPAPVAGTFYIVSALFATSAHGRDDLLMVDDAVRNEKNQVIGCRRFAC